MLMYRAFFSYRKLHATGKTYVVIEQYSIELFIYYVIAMC